MPNRERRGASPWFALAALCLAALAAIALACAGATAATESVTACPRGQPHAAEGREVREPGEQGHPAAAAFAVDWDYWRSANPDVIAWVRVPGTAIDCAIVQAPANDPEFYLTHDVYRNWNPYGCPYVDADCDGVCGPNTVVFGHNMGFGDAVFADFARYADGEFARAHPTVVIQTPTGALLLDVTAAAVVDGAEATLRTAFADRADLSDWYAERIGEASVSVSAGTGASRIFTFVTCSYNRLSNERTLVYAQPRPERTAL